MRLRRALIGGALAIGLGFALLTGSAGAGVGEVPSQNFGTANGLRYVRAIWDQNYNQGDIAVFTPCREAEAVVGGGADTNGPRTMSRISGSVPFDDDDDLDVIPDDHWFGEGQNLSTVDREFRVWAVCRKAGLDGVTYQRSGTTIFEGQTKSVAVNCEGGGSAISGGPLIYFANVRRSIPIDGPDGNKVPDDGWRVTAQFDQPGGTTLEARVACLDAERGDLKYVREGDKVAEAKSLKAACPKSKSVIGGGASIGGTGSFIHSLQPLDSKSDRKKVPDDRWEATVVNATDAAKRAKVHAICLG